MSEQQLGIHLALLLAAWRSPAEVWQAAEGWVRGLRLAVDSPGLYEAAEWLGGFEPEWRRGQSGRE